MRRSVTLAALGFIAILSLSATDGNSQRSLYAGQEKRQIKSLSAEDIAELNRGGGWGLAKAAELNGIPGPAHLLELANEIELTEEQVSAIDSIREDMKRHAVEIGAELISLEEKLDVAFRHGTITRDGLNELVMDIAETKGRLRFTHLFAHLQTRPLLSDRQVEVYNRQRGYGDAPCDSVPPGHDAQMWRKHNNCT